MKKILRIPLSLILLLGVGMLYVVKNPELPISQQILTTLGIDMSSSDNSGTTIDLTNCTSYFDGCNTCMVSGGVIGGCTRMYCETPSQPQCLEYVWTGMDLTDCVSYFDGCNNCTVENGKPSACTMMYCDTPSEPKCNEYATETKTTDKEENKIENKEENKIEDNSVCTMEYMPVCASIAVQCVKAPCPPVEETFGNKCMMNANKKATFLYDGECKKK